MDAANLRNFRDFLQLYNQMTERCFYKCVTDVNSRSLDLEEQQCIERCSTKFIRSNNRLMTIFVKAQTEMVNKRVQEAELAQQNAVQVPS